MQNTLNNGEMLCEDNIISSYFRSGVKATKDFKIGMEYERLPISCENFSAVDYNKGIFDLLREFAKIYEWKYLTDDYNIIGLENNGDRITLEPGCQFELSVNPEKTIFGLKDKFDEIDKKLTPIFKKFNIELLNYGVSPISTYKFIKLIPKKRYKIMADYLWGILSDVMMRETAGIQVCVDFSSEEDAMKKFRIANLISPFATAMFANSPIRGGVDTGYKSFRALSWLNTDNDRCGFISKKIFEKKSDYSFSEYLNDVLETPMIFIQRETPVEIGGVIDFKEFMKTGFEGYRATMADFMLQANLCFPEVRLRDFIEIRNQDCVGNNLQYAIPALYKGIMYSNDALSDIETLFKDFTYKDFEEFRFSVPRNGLKTKVGKNTASDFAKEIIKISKNALKSFGLGEDIFLEDLSVLTNNELSPCDILINHWYSDWKKDVSQMIEYLL